LVDPVTDIFVIDEWMYNSRHVPFSGYYEMSKIWTSISYIGISILSLSLIVSTFIYVYWDENHVTCIGVFLHLLGFGPVYEGMPLIKNPVAHPWELKAGESNEVGAQIWLRYFHSRAAEGVVEALPFAIFQTFVLVWTQHYDSFLVSAAVLSMVCTAFPVAEFINLRCYNHGISALDISEKLLIISLWTWDMVSRSLPIIYLIAHLKFFDWRYEFQLDTRDLGCILVLGYFLVGLIFVYSFQCGKKFKFQHILEIPALAVMLMFTSHPKLCNVGWKSGVETFVRFSISLWLASWLHVKNIINLRQLWSFSILTIISGCLQIYFFLRVKEGHYIGYRIRSEMKRTAREKENTLQADKGWKVEMPQTSVKMGQVQEKTKYEIYEGDNEHECQTSVELMLSDERNVVSLGEFSVSSQSDAIDCKHIGEVQSAAYKF